MSLKTDYKDAELASSMSGKRQYEITTNSAGYSVLTDKTAYTEVGDTFGASDINATNTVVNTLDSNLTSGTTKFRFGIDEDGNYGFYKADGGFVMFGVKSWELLATFTGVKNHSVDLSKYTEILIIVQTGKKYTFTIPVNELSSTSWNFRNGGYKSSSDYSGVDIGISLTTVSMGTYSAYENGSNVTSSATVKIYAR